MRAGTRVNTFLWARAATDDVVQLQYLLLDAANLPAASSPVDAHTNVRVNVLATWQLFTLVSLVESGAPGQQLQGLLLLTCC